MYSKDCSTSKFSNNLWIRCWLLVSCMIVVSCFDLTILHTNDVHARFQQFNKYGSDCSSEDSVAGKCFGGIARRYTKIEEIRGSHDNVLLLDAGDQFMGTTWFSVYRGLAASYFMNQLNYDVMCLGNHEFDLGVDPLQEFLSNVTFDVVSANTDVTNEPKLQGMFTKTTTKTINGEQIGIIGYITKETSMISNPGPTVTFNDVIPEVTEQVRQLQNSGVNKIIALGHAGISMDMKVAAIDGVDIAVGGHTNTFLYNGDQPSNEEIQGPYPMIVDQPGGGKGLVVQDYTWGKYLGCLNVTFDEDGNVIAHSGNPILLDNNIVEDPGILQKLAVWSVDVDAINGDAVGHSNVLLDGRREVCRTRECNLGNLITDALIDYHVNFTHPQTQWAPASIAVWNSGGIRGSIDKGTVSVGEILSVMPFRNEVDLVTVKGSDLREQLEHSVSKWTPSDPPGGFLQMSGIRVVYRLSKPVGQRVASVEVRCLECEVPKYSALDDDKDYKLLTATFLLRGGDGFSFKPSYRQSFNTLDSETLMKYIKVHSPVYAGEEGRIRFISDMFTNSSAERKMSSVFAMCLLFVAFLRHA